MSVHPAIRESDSKKPSKRFLKPNMNVQARTIGTKIMFNMPIENVSATGMLISLQQGQRAPFNVNTILELEVQAQPTSDQQNSPTKQSVQCLGKVIHTSKTVDGTSHFGIKIIQSDDDELVVWNQIISGIEADLAA